MGGNVRESAKILNFTEKTFADLPIGTVDCRLCEKFADKTFVEGDNTAKVFTRESFRHISHISEHE